MELVDAVAGDLIAGEAVALGFECPLFVPVPATPLQLGAAALVRAIVLGQLEPAPVRWPPA